jgi:predicted transposase YdaD
METDVSLKVLSRKYTTDLLRLIHEEGVAVLSVDAIEIHDVKRRVDCLIKLQSQKGVYYRHVEFQSEPDPDMARRCFRYNTQLVLQLEAPVLTTVVYLFPPGPKSGDPVFRVMLDGEEINVWRFDEVRLWELSAQEALASRAPGLLALVPLMEGGQDRGVIVRAAAAIKRALPLETNPEALAILLYLAGAHYTVGELTRLFGRETMIQSSVWQAAWSEGKAEGKAEGLRAERQTCIALIKNRHPTLLARAVPAVEACDDHAILCDWILKAPDLDSAAFARLLGIAKAT